MHRGFNRKDRASYVRSFVFGVEDSLASTVGLLSGIAVAGSERGTIVLTGMVLIFVEGVSMAMGSFLAEYTAEEYERRAEVSVRRSLVDGCIMLFSYFVSGFIPLAPYFFVAPTLAVWISVGVSLVALIGLGAIGGRLAKVSVLRNALRMALVGGIAIGVGILVGHFMPANALT